MAASYLGFNSIAAMGTWQKIANSAAKTQNCYQSKAKFGYDTKNVHCQNDFCTTVSYKMLFLLPQPMKCLIGKFTVVTNLVSWFAMVSMRLQPTHVTRISLQNLDESRQKKLDCA